MPTAGHQLRNSGQWLAYLNEAYRDVINASPFWPFKEVAGASAVTVLTNTDNITLPTDVTRVLAVRNRTDGLAMHQIDGRTAHIEAYPTGDDTGVPTFYRVLGSRLYVYPTPTVNTVFDVEHPAPPADLAAGDEPVFPEPYHTMLIEGALARAHHDDGDTQRAAGCQASFGATLDMMLTDLLGTAREAHYPGITDDWYDD